MPSHGTHRNNISLDTGPEVGENYDQICALSVKTINDNFAALWKFRPEEVTKIVFNDGEHGVMTAFLLAPRIMVNPHQESAGDPRIHFSLSFDNGSNIYYSQKSKVDLSGWVITVAASLKELCVTPVHGESKDALMDKKLALKPMKRLFKLEGRGKDGKDVEYELDQPIQIAPGQYGIHRLFAAISSSDWKDIVWEYSTKPGPDEGRPISLEAWKNDKSTNLQLMSKVIATLNQWTLMNQNSAFFTLGYQFREPEPDKTKTEKTASQICTPFATRLVTYPYIKPEAYDYQLEHYKGRAPKGDVWEDYNCLVYAETTGTRGLPDRKLLSYGGNLASPVTTQEKKEVRGTFVLDHRVFFQTQILQLLQEICMGTMIVALRPLLSPAGDCFGQFAAGRAPIQSPDLGKGQVSNKYPPVLASDEYYQFKLVGERKYEWRDNWVAPGSKSETYNHYDFPGKPLYRHWNATSYSSVTVEWETGAHKIKVSGTSGYYHWQGQSSYNPFPFEDMSPNVGYYGDHQIDSTWSFDIDLKVPKTTDEKGQTVLDYGVIEPTVERLDERVTVDGKDNPNVDLPADIKFKTSYRYTGDAVEVPLGEIRKALRERLAQLIKSLKAKFRSSGRFVYPATGTFQFGDPRLADNGDVYADVEYLPPKLTGLMTLRRPQQMPFTEPLYKEPELVSVPVNPTIRPDLMHLEWSIVSESYDHKKNWLRLVVNAKNSTGTKLAFQRVEISALIVKPPVGDKGDEGDDEDAVVRLFEEEADYWEEWKAKPPPPPPVTKPVVKPKPTVPVTAPTVPVTAPISTPAAGKPLTAPATPADPSIQTPTEANPTETPVAPTPTNNPVIKPTVPEAPEEPEPEEPTPTWLVKHKNIPDGLRLKVDRPDNLDFTILPNDKFKPGYQSRFYMSTTSTFSLTLEGTTPGPGTYVLQLRESWESPDMYDKYANSLWADAFYSIKITEDQIPEIKFVTAEEAATIQGVEAEE